MIDEKNDNENPKIQKEYDLPSYDSHKKDEIFVKRNSHEKIKEEITTLQNKTLELDKAINNREKEIMNTINKVERLKELINEHKKYYDIALRNRKVIGILDTYPNFVLKFDANLQLTPKMWVVTDYIKILKEHGKDIQKTWKDINEYSKQLDEIKTSLEIKFLKICL